ncbi:MAG: NAD(P)/FAD-dependent oxidoreductase [Promethearchaeota archaeon]
MKFDVIVAGCGTTGATAAEILSRRGFDVACLEKNPARWSRPSSGVFPNHNFVDDLPEIPEDVFERDHLAMRYVGKDGEARVDAREFGTTLGKTLRWSKLARFLAGQAERSGVRILFEHEVTGATITSDGVIVTAKDLPAGTGVELRGEILLVATGGEDFRLQSALGFDKPPYVEGIQREFAVDASDFDAIVGAEYNFHLDARVSMNGPFWVTAYEDGFNCGFIDSGGVTIGRLDRILAKYEKVRDLLEASTRLDGGNSGTHVKRIPCGIVKRMSGRRCILLGECAGLVHPFFYEGIWEGRFSALRAADTITGLRDSNPGREPQYSGEELAKYDAVVHKDLVKKFLKSGRGSRELFFGSSSGLDLFDAYIRVINKYPDVREKIVEAYNVPAHKFNLKNDRSIGERIYKSLPLGKKLTMLPRFLRAA